KTSGKELRTFSGSRGAFSPEGGQLLTAKDTTALLWETASGRQVRAFAGHAKAVAGVAFSPGVQQVPTAESRGASALWEKASGRKLRTLIGVEQFSQNCAVYSVAFSPDGRKVLTGLDHQQAVLWDVDNGEELRRFPDVITGFPMDSIAFCPDGKQIVVGS